MALRGYTAHLKPGRPPVLVQEGWSWGAFLFGPFWFMASRAWIPALLQAALLLFIAELAPERIGWVLGTALAVLAGLLGRDAIRWALDRRGYVLMHVLAARDEEAALARLLAYRPEIASTMGGLLR